VCPSPKWRPGEVVRQAAGAVGRQRRAARWGARGGQPGEAAEGAAWVLRSGMEKRGCRGLWAMRSRGLAGCCRDLRRPFPAALRRARGQVGRCCGRRRLVPLAVPRAFTCEAVLEPRLRAPCLLDAEVLNSCRREVFFYCCPFKT